MTIPNQYAIRDVAKATFYDLVTGKAKVQLNNLKMSNLENTATTVYARGSSGNPKLVGFTSDRDTKVTLQDAVFGAEILAMMTGNDLKTGAIALYQREVLTVTSNATTLTHTPAAAGALISVYIANPDETHGTEITYAASAPSSNQYSVTSKSITLGSGTVTDGGKIIAYYQTTSDSTPQTITISSDKFAGSYKVVLDCLVRDAYTKSDYAAQIIIPTAKLDDNWKVMMQPTGDPAVLDIALDVLRPAGSNDMYTMTIFDSSLLT